MQDLKTLFMIRAHRIRWAWWNVGLTGFFWFLMIVLDHFRIAFHFSINPFTIIKDYVEAKDGPPYLLLLFILIAVLIATTMKMVRTIKDLRSRGIRWSDENTYGSAQEATVEEISDVAPVRPIEECEGPILGSMTPTGTKDVIDFNTNGNTNNCNALIIGPPGTGKTITYVLNAVYQAIKREESALVVDTKGAVYNGTVELARKNGYVIRCFNLKDFSFSHGWDIFKECYDRKTGEISNSRIKMIAEILVDNDEKNTGDEIYVKGSIALIQAAIHFVASNDSYGNGPGKKPRTLTSAHQLLLRNKAPELEQLFDRNNKLCSEQAYNAWDAYRQASQNFQGNLITNVLILLQHFNDAMIQEITSKDEIDLTLPAKQKCLYYLTIPDVNNPYQIFSALFVQMFFTDTTTYADSLQEQVCPVPINMILDEFTNLGKLINFAQKPAVVRSRGIAIAMIVQSLSQLKTNYRDSSWETIIGTCATWIILGSQDMFTLEYISKMAGTATINTESQQQTTRLSLFNFGMPRSVGEGKRNVINPDEIRRMPWIEEIILLEHKNPLRAYKFIHKNHPYFNECIPTQIYHMPEISDKDGRAYWNAMERERITQYYAWRNSGMKAPQPKVYTLEELKSGDISLTDYRNQWKPETIAVTDLLWKSPEEQESKFKGRLTREEAKHLQNSTLSTKPSAIPKDEKPEAKATSEETETETAEPVQTIQVPPAAKATEIEKLFAPEQVGDNEMLKRAFGLNPTGSGRGMPSRTKGSQADPPNGKNGSLL